MNISVDDFDQINKVASSSGVFIGILGGVVKAITSAKGLLNGLCQVFVGCVVSWLSAPFVRAYFPLEVYPMVVFLFGYGGTELIVSLQKVFNNVISSKFSMLSNALFGIRRDDQVATVKQLKNLN